MEDKLAGKFHQVKELEAQKGEAITVWLNPDSYREDFPVLLTKQVFTNKDGSHGELYLVTNDLELTAQAISATYKERWGVEVFHKSLKQEVGLEKSPTKHEVTQSNHVFAAMIAWTKMELLRIKEQSNHSALKTKLYVKALKAAYEELQVLKELPPKVLQTAALDVPLLG